jgi:hypothetical protein
MSHLELGCGKRISQHLPGSGDPALQSQVYLLYLRGNLTNTATCATNSKEVSFGDSLFGFRETVCYGVVDDGLHLTGSLF